MQVAFIKIRVRELDVENTYVLFYLFSYVISSIIK